MKYEFDDRIVSMNQWELEGIEINHSIVEYNSFGSFKAHNPNNKVRLHFGLEGDYDFNFKQLKSFYELRGEHNNIMYSDGLDIEVFNKSKKIETFGVNFSVDTFIKIAENGNEALKRLADDVINQKDTILSTHWRTNNFRINQVIQDIIHCPFNNELKNTFLLAKSLELLVAQADLYEQNLKDQFIKKKSDKEALIEAKNILSKHLDSPPTIHLLSKMIGLNEYKLKKGFKELFGTTVFGFIHKNRMELARQLLLGTDKSAKEIAYEAGYSSPQHFSKAFKKEYDVSPNSIRNAPDITI